MIRWIPNPRSGESAQGESRLLWLMSYARWYKAQSLCNEQRFAKGVQRIFSITFFWTSYCLLRLQNSERSRLCSKENFREPFGLPSILTTAPRPPSWSLEYSHLMKKYLVRTRILLVCLSPNLIVNFHFWVRQKPACCLMKPIKVFVPFRFKTQNASNTAELVRF